MFDRLRLLAAFAVLAAAVSPSCRGTEVTPNEDGGADDSSSSGTGGRPGSSSSGDETGGASGSTDRGDESSDEGRDPDSTSGADDVGNPTTTTTTTEGDTDATTGGPRRSQCEGVADGLPCPDTVGGTCLGGSCCGDAVMEGAETCDDGNQVPLDGCSATCRVSTGCETCMADNCAVPLFARPLPPELLQDFRDEGLRLDVYDDCLTYAEGFPPEVDGAPTWSDLCLDFLRCAEVTGCSSLQAENVTGSVVGSEQPIGCLCGDLDITECQSTLDLQGPCALELSALTGSTVPSEISPLFSNLALPVGVATNLLGCANVECAEVCSFSAPYCGNEIIDQPVAAGLPRIPVDECDDGNRDDGDGCNAQCRLEVCGDGVVNGSGSEVCDDGNTADHDGCESDCTPSPPAECGNEIVELHGAEQCDDGNTSDGDGCSATCAIEFCGDGITNNGEGCDDGGLIAGDGCSPLCTVEFCGDGIVGEGEACDGPDEFGACNSNCTRPVCGNAVLEAGEACDDGIEGSASCSPACTRVDCGNGIVDLGEQCDDGNTIAGDGCSTVCVTEFCGDGIVNDVDEACDGTVDCSPDCTLVVCGNGQLEAGEGCDDGNIAPGDGCSSLCTIEVCGNGVVDLGEACDDGNVTPGDGCEADCSTSPLGPREICRECVAENCTEAGGFFDATTGCPNFDPECVDLETGDPVVPCFDDPLCDAILRCAEESGCYEGPTNSFPDVCLCGDASITNCQTQPFGSALGANGACVDAYVAAFGTDVGTEISPIFINFTERGGRANLELACRNDFCRDVCTIPPSG